jgi:hypothetical protein
MQFVTYQIGKIRGEFRHTDAALAGHMLYSLAQREQIKAHRLGDPIAEDMATKLKGMAQALLRSAENPDMTD